jgi:hypothetical protein
MGFERVSENNNKKKSLLKKICFASFLFFSRLADRKLLLIYKIVFSLTGLSMNLQNILFIKKICKIKRHFLLPWVGLN